MRLLLAIVFPPLLFFTIWRPFQGFLCLLLWATVIGWPVAAIWAVYALTQYRNDQLYDEMRHGYYREGYRR